MSMSKKDYEMVTDSLAETHVAILAHQNHGLPPGAVDGIINAVATGLAQHMYAANPRFNRNSFFARYHDNVARLKKEMAKKVTGR